MPRYQRVYVYSPFPCLYSVCISFHDSLINSLGSAEVICTTRPANQSASRPEYERVRAVNRL